MANESNDRNDAADERQNEPRRGLEGKGFDAGTGYGGAGNSSLYNGESGYGGQSAEANNSRGGAYQGEGYGRTGGDDAMQAGAPAGAQGDGQEAAAGDAQGGGDGGRNVGRDTDGLGSANQSRSASTPRGPDEQAVNDAFEGRGAQPRGPDAIDI